MKNLVLLASLPCALLWGAAAVAAQSTYELTITNHMAKQGLSPFVLALSQDPANVFALGQSASPGLGALAEDGHTERLRTELRARHPEALLQDLKGVKAGGKIVYRIMVSDSLRFVTLASMIGTTNDTFVAAQGVALPERGVLEVTAPAFDAGTEKNSESCRFIPGPPCGNHDARDPSPGEVVTEAAGIAGQNDVPRDFSWGPEPVTVRIERKD